MKPDFTVSYHGTICLLNPCTVAARNWIDEHIGDEAQHWDGAVVVEHRYIDALLDGIIADGWNVGETR